MKKRTDEFGSNLKVLLHMQNKKQRDLALYLVDGDKEKMRPTTVSDWIHGRKMPNMTNLYKTAEFFKLSVNDLFKPMFVEEKILSTLQEDKPALLENCVDILNTLDYNELLAIRIMIKAFKYDKE